MQGLFVKLSDPSASDKDILRLIDFHVSPSLDILAIVSDDCGRVSCINVSDFRLTFDSGATARVHS